MSTVTGIKLNKELQRALQEHDVEVVEPRARMIQMNGVAAGEKFSKPRTNMLLLQHDRGWEIFVDEDFYYVGLDSSRRRLFCGATQSHWMCLRLTRPPQGDASDAILAALQLVSSPILQGLKYAADQPLHDNPETEESPSELAAFGQLLQLEQPMESPVHLSEQQADMVARILSAVSREVVPIAPLLLGPAGSGKTTLAKAAARDLLRGGFVHQTLLVRGAALSCGTIFRPQRDERLGALLEKLLSSPGTLLLMEEFQLAADHSASSALLLADAIDRGLKMIAVASPGLPLGVARVRALTRRLDTIRMPELEPREVSRLLESRLAEHPLGENLDVASEVFPIVLNLSSDRRGANPGAALGLLDAVLSHARCTGSSHVSPDDVYHVANL